ncbi:MAG: hypothetical protein EAX86_00940 [Candidatus Heimdallarchaeota archaeon]|nr:hypothetical protein [Candidatus Heimdallarchaeota archaeon]
MDRASASGLHLSNSKGTVEGRGFKIQIYEGYGGNSPRVRCSKQILLGKVSLYRKRGKLKIIT